MKRVNLYLMLSVMLLNADYVLAADLESQQAEIGDSALSWFELQASGKAAAPVAAMSGAQASAAYTRYLKSFDKPIPERFGSTIKNGVAVENAGGG
jgi:hypothetical protein